MAVNRLCEVCCGACLILIAGFTLFEIVCRYLFEWQAWLDFVGVGHQIMEGGHRFDYLFVALHAVRDGLGSIIAPENLLGASFARQELAAPLPNMTLKGVPYFVHRTPRAEGRHVSLFTDWLHRAAA